MKEIRSCTLLLMLVMLPLVLSPGVRADEFINMSRSIINLTDRNTTGQIVMNMALENPSSFAVTVQAPAHGGGQDRNYFYLKPKGQKADKNVKVHIDFPYEQLTPGGPYQPESINTVEVNGRRAATNQYTLCPGTAQSADRGRVCKPFSLVVIDDGAVPGVQYQTKLNVFVQSGHGQPVKKTITLNYVNTRSAIGIYSPNDRFLLNTGNNFTSENSFCVYSHGESRSFDVRLEGQGKQKQLHLQGKNSQSVAYNARVSGSGNRSYQGLPANVWHPLGTTQRLANKSSHCGAARNLWLELNIPENEVMKAPAGHYTGVLTVRVRAK